MRLLFCGCTQAYFTYTRICIHLSRRVATLHSCVWYVFVSAATGVRDAVHLQKNEMCQSLKKITLKKVFKIENTY